MADKAVVTQTTLDAIGQAIIAKGGATDPMTPAQMPAAIATIPTGKPNSEGTPDDGWKNDGASHFWNYGDEDGWTFKIDIGSVIDAPVTIVWGDGQSETLNVSSRNNVVTHVYSKKGAYRVDVVSDEGGKVSFGALNIMLSGDNRSIGSLEASSRYTHAEIGSNASQERQQSLFRLFPNLIGIKIECIGGDSSQMAYQTKLKYCEVGEGFTSLRGAFHNCSLFFKRFIFPRSVTDVANALQNSYGVEEIDFSEPSSVTVLNQTMRAVRTAKKISIPSSVVEITNYALAEYNNTASGNGLEIHFRGTIPPTFNDSTSIQLPSDAKVFVPYSADHSVLTAYKAAPNLSVYADQIYEEEES